MMSLRVKIPVFAALFICGLFISPVVFSVFGGVAAIVFLRAGFWIVFSALILEVFAGLPVGVISIPLAFANIMIEFLRDKLNSHSSASLAIIFFFGTFIFAISHITAMNML